jgi:hypothetical protein
MVKAAILSTAVRVSILCFCCFCARDFITSSSIVPSPSQKRVFKARSTCVSYVAIKPEAREVKQLDEGIDHTFVSIVREEVFCALVRNPGELKNRYEGMVDTFVQLRGPFCSG